MSEEAFDCEEQGFIFSDEDFGRRYFPQQRPSSAAGVNNQARPGIRQADPNTAPIHGGGNSFMRSLRRRLAAAASKRSN
jgi:hypothetical protein